MDKARALPLNACAQALQAQQQKKDVVKQHIGGVGGVRMLTRQLALEPAPHGIRANAVAPGPIETDLKRADIGDDGFRTCRLSMIPLGIIGDPEGVVGAVVFLASDQSRLASGASLFIDGAQSIA